MPAEPTTASDPHPVRARRFPLLAPLFTFAAVSSVFSAGTVIAAATPDDSQGAPASEPGDPLLPGWAYLIIVLVAVALFVLLLGRRVIAANDRRETTWIDAWAKTAVIVVGLIVATVIVPAKALELETVQSWSGEVQDLITLGLWSGGLALGLLALWYAHRERRI